MSIATAETAEPNRKVVTAPEAGQLVEVRRRQWVVADVQASARNDERSSPQHCLTLTSIDEDSLGQQIDVIWEIEPGAHIIEKAGLPTITGQDDTERLEAFLDAIHSTNSTDGTFTMEVSHDKPIYGGPSWQH